mgnify:CR=1 FL=1
MMRDLTLSVDVGTGSVRAALVDSSGVIVHIAAREHEQIVPAFGWAEQRPEDWWLGVVESIRMVLAAVHDARSRISAICVCGQMHGTVLVDAAGELTRHTAPLWNDKRTIDLVADFERGNAPETYLALTANPPTPAWPGFKLAWLRGLKTTYYLHMKPRHTAEQSTVKVNKSEQIGGGATSSARRGFGSAGGSAPAGAPAASAPTVAAPVASAPAVAPGLSAPVAEVAAPAPKRGFGFGGLAPKSGE